MRDSDWLRLLGVLRAHGRVSQPSPGRVSWELDGSVVQIVMTPDDWAGWSRSVMGDVDATADLVLADARHAVAEGTPYLVFDTYELHPSGTPESPLEAEREADRLRYEEVLRQAPGAHLEWRAHSPAHDPSHDPSQ